MCSCSVERLVGAGAGVCVCGGAGFGDTVQLKAVACHSGHANSAIPWNKHAAEYGQACMRFPQEHEESGQPLSSPTLS